MPKAKSKQETRRRRLTLSLKAPRAKEVILVGDFNNWNAKVHPMKKDKKGVWTRTLMLFPGNYEYKLLVDGQWQNDPGNDQVCSNCFGTQNNILSVPKK